MPLGLGLGRRLSNKKDGTASVREVYSKNKKSNQKGSVRWRLKQSLKKTLGNGITMKDAVKLPPGEIPEEWIAMNTFEIYNSVTLSWAFVSDFCTEETCPKMTAGANEYLWEDKYDYPKPTSVPAAKYVDLLLIWVSKQLDNEEVFPNNGPAFGKQFLSTVKLIWRRLARVFFHIYYHHWETVQTLQAEAHVNSCFKHFNWFLKEFNLVEIADLEPVKPLIDKL